MKNAIPVFEQTLWISFVILLTTELSQHILSFVLINLVLIKF